MKKKIAPVLSYSLIFLFRKNNLGWKGPFGDHLVNSVLKTVRLLREIPSQGLNLSKSRNCTAPLGNHVPLFEHLHGVNIFPVSN